jgi:hypothetical protein
MQWRFPRKRLGFEYWIQKREDFINSIRVDFLPYFGSHHPRS